ncbi:LysR substrate-binding domain-containing protein [Saccharopolyspora sp. K220]|uniref:LysR substrate-binding domain-containing protein n=1 Tax=Saccharopolyspora soli TaxID=2926618 RepID=UPI001F58D244|nr:LysR substrate-binding domain-containing protein [Saccharopolyspora soli]MCI2416951.1 LysR substrate-binding domain-containing protein [Saccharopolyspora soli]
MAIDLRLMRYVIVVSEAGSFEAAAERLHMTQPPLSRQIRDLERELGVELFHRRPTRLTEAGRVFVESAREVLAAAERTVERTRHAGRARTGTVRVGYTVTAAFAEMPKLFDAMREQHPGIRVDAREAWDSELSAAAENDELDVVLGRYVATPPTCQRTTLRRDRFAVVVGSAHPLAGRDAVSLSDLRGETVRFFPRTFAPRYYDATLAALHSTGETFEIWENPLPGLRNLNVHLKDRGFMFLPLSLRDHLPGGVACLPIPHDLPVNLDIAWRRPPQPATRALVETACRLAREEGWIPGPPG